MKHVTYTPPEADPDFPRFTSQFGHRFEDGKPVAVSHPDHLAKFRGNPYFTVSDPAETAKPARKERA
jgi:hypothetical protein